MEPKRKIIVILGPTASGKSALAVKLLKNWHEIILPIQDRYIKSWILAVGKSPKKK